MKKYVVDASVVLTGILENQKTVVDEVREYFVQAEGNKLELYSSSFLKMEVCNGLRFNEKDLSKSTKLLSVFFKLPIKFIDFNHALYEESLSTSYKLNATVYDTSYHILAKAHNAVFLTCDEEYYKKAKGLGDIELIADFEKTLDF